MCACLNIDHSLITCSIDFNIVNIHHTVGMYFLILTGNMDDIEWHDLQRSYQPFFHHYQGSIDFNTVNIHRTVGMYFLVSTGNRGDIE